MGWFPCHFGKCTGVRGPGPPPGKCTGVVDSFLFFWKVHTGSRLQKGSLAPWTPVHFLKVHTGSGFCRKVHRGCRAPCESAPGAGGSASKTGKGKSAPGFEVEKVHRGWSLLPRCTFRYLEPRCTFKKVHRGKGLPKKELESLTPVNFSCFWASQAHTLVNFYTKKCTGVRGASWG